VKSNVARGRPAGAGAERAEVADSWRETFDARLAVEIGFV
jgi:hypothetical protein